VAYDNKIMDTLIHYLSERHLIWERRQNGEKLPFTKDSILAKYKFTNVLRSRDYTTRWLVDNWYKPNHNQPGEIQALNCAIARYFGRVEFLEDLGYQYEWNPTYILEVARRRFREKKSVFTGAYIITNQGMTDPKEEVVVNCFLSPYRIALPELVETAQETNSWRAVAEKLSRLPGMGAFMTKEILLDWQLTSLLSNAVDKLTWTPAGPGAIRGLNRLHGRPLNAALKQGDALREMKELTGELASAQAEGLLPETFPIIGVDFGVTDVQFNLCELDKYVRVVNGEGRPRSTFRPRK